MSTVCNDSQRISVCICTMNRPNDLEKALNSLAECHDGPDEVIVSDDSKISDPNRELCQRFPFVRYQHGPARGLGANRNACLNAVKGEIVHFIDDDVTVPNDFYRIARALLKGQDTNTILSGGERKHVDGATVEVKPNNPNFWGFQQVPVLGVCRAIVINATLFPAALFEHARFDENLRYGSEELDMARHAVALGYRIDFQPGLVLDHYPSAANRSEYSNLVEASRLYATLKAYLQYDNAPAKAAAYSVLAPIHLLLGSLKRYGANRLGSDLRAIRLAWSYFRARPKIHAGKRTTS